MDKVEIKKEMTSNEMNALFEEIERIDNLMHSTVKVNDGKLREILEGHICMCGSVIFASFLPDEIQEAYYKWHNRKCTNSVIESAVEEITTTVDKDIVSRLKNCTDKRR